jgi:hypothetical protein
MAAASRVSALALLVALVQGSAAFAGPLAMPLAADEGMLTLARRTAPVARCVGRKEDDCRIRRYCWWIADSKRRGVLVPGHCKMRNFRWDR